MIRDSVRAVVLASLVMSVTATAVVAVMAVTGSRVKS